MTIARAPTPPLTSRRFGAVNWRGLFTLMERELRGMFRSYSFEIAGPIVSCLLYLAVFHLAYQAVALDEGARRLPFIASGIIIYAVMERAYQAISVSLLVDKHERAIVDTLMAPLSAIERLVGYVGGAMLSGLIIGVAVALASLIFAPLTAAQPGWLIYFALAGAMLYGQIGLLVGIWAEKWDQYSAILTFILLPLSFLSGVFYRLLDLPPLAQAAVMFNPVFHVINGFRYGMTGIAEANVFKGALFLAATNLGLALWAYRWLKRGYRLKA